MYKVTVINVVLMTMLIGFSAFAGTPQEVGKWKEGELLLENHSFEDDLAAWELEDGTCCDRGGEYKMEIDRKNPQHGNKCLKVIGIKATGTNWHAKVKQRNVSMKAGETYTVIFWARSEKPRQVSLNIQEQQDPWTFWQGGDINLTGPEWAEYFVTFTAKETVARNMWVGLSIAQSDVDFWIDNFRYFEGEPEDDLSRDEPFPVDAKEKLATQWASVKTNRF
ncbi:MAG: carbohydrate binding domain-containing protein [Candidatus Poribacteria bacterium]|nr:carbohydrate binding domain-containing protein [Candidatus Poribacteria bacterium]